MFAGFAFVDDGLFNRDISDEYRFRGTSHSADTVGTEEEDFQVWDEQDQDQAQTPEQELEQENIPEQYYLENTLACLETPHKEMAIASEAIAEIHPEENQKVLFDSSSIHDESNVDTQTVLTETTISDLAIVC